MKKSIVVFVLFTLYLQFYQYASAEGVRPRIGIGSFSGGYQYSELITKVLKMNLIRAGNLQLLEHIEIPLSASQIPDWEKWRNTGVDFVAGGETEVLSNGKLRCKFRVWDVQKMSEVGARQFDADIGATRHIAHELAELTLMVLTGVKGGFTDRRLSVVRRSERYVLEVADSDGANGHAALSSPKPILMPTWFPQREHIAYVSLEASFPMIWVQDITSGRRLPAGNANSLGPQCAEQTIYFSVNTDEIPALLFGEEWRKFGAEICAAELLRVALIGMQDSLRK